MPAKALTTTQIRTIVQRTALQLAEDRNIRLSDAAIRALLADSTNYFAEHAAGAIKLTRLRETLAPILAAANNEANPAPASARTKRKGQRTYLRSQRPRQKTVAAAHIRTALSSAQCHYLWFC